MGWGRLIDNYHGEGAADMAEAPDLRGDDFLEFLHRVRFQAYNEIVDSIDSVNVVYLWDLFEGFLDLGSFT